MKPMPVVRALDDPRLRLCRGPDACLCRLNEAAACDRHEREGSQAGTSFIPLAIPPDGQGEHIGKGQGRDMRDYSKRLKQVFDLIHSISTSVNLIRGKTDVSDPWSHTELLGNTPDSGAAA
jgi:hypothetical protein